MRQVVTAKDIVVEVGCHEGLTTELASRAAELAIGIDSSDYSIGKARDRFADRDNLYFCDAVDGSDIRAAVAAMRKIPQWIAKNESVTVVLIDVSGSRDPGFVLDILIAYDRRFRPQTFIIKNFKLQNVIANCKGF